MIEKQWLKNKLRYKNSKINSKFRVENLILVNKYKYKWKDVAEYHAAVCEFTTWVSIGSSHLYKKIWKKNVWNNPTKPAKYYSQFDKLVQVSDKLAQVWIACLQFWQISPRSLCPSSLSVLEYK